MTPKQYINEVRGEIQVARIRALADVYASAYASAQALHDTKAYLARRAVQDFVDLLNENT